MSELWEHRNDPDEWSEEVETRPSGSAVVSFRIPWDELEELDEAATVEGESLSEFIRKAVRLRAARSSRPPKRGPWGVYGEAIGNPKFFIGTNPRDSEFLQSADEFASVHEDLLRKLAKH